MPINIKRSGHHAAAFNPLPPVRGAFAARVAIAWTNGTFVPHPKFRDVLVEYRHRRARNLVNK